MRWSRQVVHVAWKDARMLRWFLAVTVGIALLFALRAGGGLTNYWLLTLLLSGIGIVAVAVQADPPVRGEAFWVTRPLSPAAVLVAKLVAVVAVLVLAAGSELGILFRHAVPLREYPGLLGHSALYYGILLGGALAVAVVTQDLRGFGFGWMLLLLVWAALVSLMPHDAVVVLRKVPAWLMPALVVGGGVVVAGYQYLTGRRVISFALIALFGLGAAVAVPGFAFAGEDSAGLPPLPAGLRPRAIEAAVFDSGGGGVPANGLAVRLVGANPRYKYVLWDAWLGQPGQGPGRPIMGLPYAALTQLPPAALGLPGLSWAGQPSDPTATAWAHIGFWPARQSPSSQVLVRGKLEVAEGKLLVRLPLEVGRSVVKAGYRLEITELSNDRNGAHVKLRISTAGSASESGSSRVPNFMLLDLDRKLLFVMNSRSQSSRSYDFLVRSMERVQDLSPRIAGTVRLPQVGQDRLELVVAETRIIAAEDVSVPVQRVKGAPPAMMDYDAAWQ